MKKIMRFCAVFLSVLAVFSAAVPASAAEQLSVEQVQLSPPDVDFYVYSEGKDLSGLKTDDVSATLGKYSFDVDSVVPQDESANDGVFYAFLLDISGSIPQASLDAAVRSISKIADTMGPDDKLCAISFGDDVKVISDGSKKPADTVAALKKLKARDQTTKFYSAMDKLISVASKKATGMRTVAVVVSDGVDDTDAGMTEKELTSTLKNSGIAVYAMQVGKVTKEQTSHLKKFISVSGGEVYRFNEKNATKVVSSLTGHISDVVAIHLKGDKDISLDDDSNLMLIVKGFAPIRWKVDKKAWDKAAKANPGEGKAEEAEAAPEETAAAEQTAINDKDYDRQQMIIRIAIAAVIVITLIVVLILMVIRNRHIKANYFKQNGIDENTVENFDKEIKKKRRMK